MVRTREIPSARNQQRNVTNRNSSTNNRNSQKSNIIEKNKFQKGGIKTPIAAPTPTPSTIATKATVSTYDMTIRSSINSSTAKENMEDMSSSSRHHRVVVADGNTRPTTTHEHVNKAPNTDDILARWKRESIRQPDRPMKDITNKVTSQTKVKHQISRRGNSSIEHTEDYYHQGQQHTRQSQNTTNHSEMDALAKHQLDVTLNDNNDVEEYQYEYSQDDEMESNTIHDNDGRDRTSSALTTPTANTALNTLGIDRLFNRKISESNNKAGIRLFSNSQSKKALLPHVISSKSDNHNEFSSQQQSPDVSLITQDTDLMMINLQNADDVDVDGILEQIDQEKAMRENRNRSNGEIRNGNNLNNLSQVPNESCAVPNSYRSTIQGSMHNKKSMSSIAFNHSNNHNNNNSNSNNSDNNRNNNNYSNNNSETQKAFYSLQSTLDKSRAARREQGQKLKKQNEELSRLSVENTRLKKELEGHHSTTARNTMLLAEQIQNLHLALGSTQKRNFIVAEEDEPESINEVLDLMRRLTEDQVPQLINYLSSKKDELKIVKSSLGDKEKELEQTLSTLEMSQQEEHEHQLTLSNLTNSISSKQAELSDIKFLCEEKVQSAHEIERRANLLINESSKRKAEIQSMERELHADKEEFENDRMAWEAQIQLKHDAIEKESKMIEEDRKEIILLSESLDSNREELEKKSEEISSVQNKLLELEASIEEKQNMMSKEEVELGKRMSDFDEQQHELQVAEDELTHSCLSFAKERKEFESEQEKLVSRTNAFEEERKEFEDERNKFMERIAALEKNEAELKSAKQSFNAKLSKFRNTVKLTKEDAEKKRREHNKLNEQLKNKEKDLDERIVRNIQEEDRIAKRHRDLSSQEHQLEKDRLQFGCSVNDEKSTLNETISRRMKEESSLEEIRKKRKVAEKALASINSDANAVRETIKKKINAAQVELASLQKDFDTKQRELNLHEEKKLAIDQAILGAEKAKDIIIETLKVKESILEKVEIRIGTERDSWDETSRIERSNLDIELMKQRKQVKERLRRMQEDAASAMNRLSKQLYTKHEKASNELMERARQVDLLHTQLSKTVEQTKRERQEINDQRLTKDNVVKELNGYRSKIQEKQSKILSLIDSNEKLQCQYNDLQVSLRESKIESNRQQKDLSKLRHEFSLEVEDHRAEIEEVRMTLNKRSASIEEKEKMMRSQHEHELQELSHHRALLKAEKEQLSQDLQGIESKQDEFQIESDRLVAKNLSLTETERKLKDYAHMLKKQGKDIKQKEKGLQNAMKLLSQQKKNRLSNDNQLITNLKKVLQEEQTRYRELQEHNKRIEEDVNIKEEMILQLRNAKEISDTSGTQQKLHELAMQLRDKDEQLIRDNIELERRLKESDEHLSREKMELEEKLLKCQECETRLAAWQKKLESFASELTHRE